MTRALVYAAAAVRFGCEVAALVALGWFGWEAGAETAGWPGAVLGALLLPVLAALVWATFCSPRRRVRLGRAATALVQAAVFAAAVVALVLLGQPGLALLLGGAAAASAGLLALLEPGLAALDAAR